MKKNQAEKKSVKKFIFFALVFVFVLAFFSFSKIAYAADVLGTMFQSKISNCSPADEGSVSGMANVGGSMTSISVFDQKTSDGVKKVVCQDQRNGVERLLDQAKTWAQDKAWKQLQKAGDVAYKAGLKYFLNTLAYDTATYLATGDKGQMPMFETQGWGGYLQNVADNTAGAIIEDLGKTGPIKFNLCQPNINVMLKINLGLQNTYRPRKPACTFTEMTKNWDTALKDKDFLPKFQDMFNPWSNDLGIALTLQTGIESEISQKVSEATSQRLTDHGFKPVTEPISGNIKTSAGLVKEYATNPIRNSTLLEGTYTGSAIADALDIFINTLAGKLLQKWFKDGLVTDFPPLSNRLDDLTNPNAQNLGQGIAGAQNRLRSLIEPSFKVRGDYDILAELTMCPDPNKAGPTNCVIDQKFREAIEKRLTVGQAMDQGYLNANGVFGFTSDGLEPRFNEGYPYRSMLILRKFRILPMGWEVAAQYIKDCQNNTDPAKCQNGNVNGTKNLKDLVDCFSGGAAWCAGLVDPNWVLKAEQNFCKKEGAGPEIISEQITGEGTGSSLSILRNDAYCADEQSCIKEKSDGACQAYGYCTEERRKWDFNGKSCEPRDNTCLTFSGSDGQTISYLQNTLDYAGCNAGNAGCKKYAANGTYDVTSKTVDWDIADNQPVYLNKNATACDAADQGCHGLVRVFPDKNTTYDDIETRGVFKAYASSTSLIYEKLLPDYLTSACYQDMGDYYKLKDTAPDECQDFVRQCKKAEVGCELYTSAADNSEVPAKVKPADYCPAACVGYDTFVQKATNFDISRPVYFIPKTAKSCTAEAAGCEQFTNLDEVAKGGEGIEYYTALRQCIKPNTAGSTCGEFYTWEGSDESGYQLKVASLKVDGTEPEVTSDDSTLCSEAIYNLTPDNPAYNSDCRQFYNRQGDISYHLYNRAIFCVDDCHPYRKTVAADDTAGSCTGGGVWNGAACVYMAVPKEGATCAAAQSGCREYTGNTGNDVRNIFTDDFSDGTTGNWSGLNGSTVLPSSDALTLDANNKGSSLSIAGNPFTARRSIGGAVTEGKSYVLSFVAKAAAPADLKISLVNANGEKANFGALALKNEWKIFKTNLENLNHEATSSEYFLFEGGNNFNIDSLTLTEITDRYYLIKNSWKDNCDYLDADTSKAFVGDLYYTGCDKYADRASKTHYLSRFSELCSESAVGCELMIDTHNSTATTSESFVNSGTTVTVPADSFIYAVYDKEKLCSREAKGCALLGQTYKYDGATLYGDAYLKNDPDKYKTILCGENAVDCQTFAYDKGEKYFKDPGDMACEWRRQTGAGESYGWYKKKVKRCGSDTGAVCLSNDDCSGGLTCTIETTDKTCPLDIDSGGLAKTLGTGGVVPISQPAGGWAGICAAANSGCGEYLDPISNFNSNIIFNGSFQTLATSPTDGWGAGLKQNVTLEPNTVYRLARLAAGAGALSLSGCSPANALHVINENNNLAGAAASITLSAAANANSKIFYHKGSAVASCTVTAGSSAGAVELKKAVIDYQLAENLDSAGCNGVVDFNKGCVLFNQRVQNGSSLSALIWDADRTNPGGAPAAGASGDKDSNVILKVAPDRTCDKWLACRSYIKDDKGNNICYDVGLCDAVDDNGNCQSFITSLKENQIAENLGADKISNLSGYAKVGITGGSITGDYYPFGAMKQVGEVVNLANGGFEFYGANGYPMGWVWSGQQAAGKSWDTNVFSVINNPISAQTEGVGYAREGSSFLKLGSSYDATSEELDIMPNTDYIITAYVNTKNLKIGVAKIDIVKSTGSATAITQNLGNDWQFAVGKFSSGADSRIKIKFYSALTSGGTIANSAGNFYFDDVKIRPALNSKDNWYTAQSCRLYPKTDSLSCDYYEDSGNRKKGWPGYCLEYDRAPGNPNACILWYPIDKVKGDGIEEGAGYQGKMPVYYCTKFKGGVLVEQRANKVCADNCSCAYKGTRSYSDCPSDKCEGYGCAANKSNKIAPFDQYETCDGNGCGNIPHGYKTRLSYDCGTNCPKDGGGERDNYRIYVEPNEAPVATVNGVKWYNYDGDLQNMAGIFNEADNSVRLYVLETGELLDPKIACEQVVQTVTSVGQNKYWSSRVYKGSDYKTYISSKPYSTSDIPFGSILPPYPVNNPYEWDGLVNTDTNKNIQPIYVKGSGANAGSPYSCQGAGCANFGFCSLEKSLCYKGLTTPADAKYPYQELNCKPSETCQPLNPSIINSAGNREEIKLLFAQSYGAWDWNWDGTSTTTGRYKPASGWSDWTPPVAVCGPNRVVNGWCSIPPEVSNIKVNSSATDVNITKNGFINLTFNTKVDAEQLPLVRYAVDWGDDEKTTVTGVEMRDRPEAGGNPHSLYHLYSYWDLKAKANRGVPGIDCTTAGQCKVKPKVQIKDNWGWCNSGENNNLCPGLWDNFGGYVVVKEKVEYEL